MKKVLIPIQADDIAPRFDLANEVIIARIDNGSILGEPRTIVMERPSDEDLCQMIVDEGITDVICGGIDEIHYNFLVWKKVLMQDRVIGSWRAALERLSAGQPCQGDIL